MGMITRVRGRLHSFTKIDPQLKDEKIAETVCLLSILFLLPYCGRGHAPLLLGLGGMWLATYSFLVLPVLISANYKYPVRWLKQLIEHLPGFGSLLFRILFLFVDTFKLIEEYEKLYLKMTALHVFLNQLFFFGMCEIALTKYDLTKNIMAELNTLLLYSIVTYFIQRTINIIQFAKCKPLMKSKIKSKRWKLNSFTICIIKLLLEWAKAIIVIVCLKEQGLKVKLNPNYMTLTLIYYICTEPTYVKLLPDILKKCNFQFLEGLETLYVRAMLETVIIFISIILVVMLLPANFYFALFSLYQTVILRYKSATNGCWKMLDAEKHLLDDFPRATKRQLRQWNDICAVCLCNMTMARVTSCGHIFHGECLRRCMKSSNKCPLCKAEILRKTEEHRSVLNRVFYERRLALEEDEGDDFDSILPIIPVTPRPREYHRPMGPIGPGMANFLDRERRRIAFEIEVANRYSNR